MTDLLFPGIQRVVEIASRKGVTLDIRRLRESRQTLSAGEFAIAVGAELGQIVKSVVCVAQRPGGRLVAIVCLVSGRNQLGLDLLAAVTGEVDVREATAREARDLLGYSAGSMPPFGHERSIQIVMDRDLCGYQWVWAAAGMDSAVFRISPMTLRMLANATVAPVAQASWMRSTELSEAQPGRSFEAGAGA